MQRLSVLYAQPPSPAAFCAHTIVTGCAQNLLGFLITTKKLITEKSLFENLHVSVVSPLGYLQPLSTSSLLIVCEHSAIDWLCEYNSAYHVVINIPIIARSI